MNINLIQCSLQLLHISFEESLSFELVILALDFANSDSSLSANPHSPSLHSENNLIIAFYLINFGTIFELIKYH